MNNSETLRIKNITLKPINKKKETKDTGTQKQKIPNIGKGLQSLFQVNLKSHYNEFIGYSRIPHKYDHFHDRTLPGFVHQSLIHSVSPRSPDFQENLLLVSECLDLKKVKNFYSRQKIYDGLFDASRLSRLSKKKDCEF